MPCIHRKNVIICLLFSRDGFSSNSNIISTTFWMFDACLQNLLLKLILACISIHPNPICFYKHPKLKTFPSVFFRKREKASDLTIQQVKTLLLFWIFSQHELHFHQNFDQNANPKIHIFFSKCV